jgi:cleavage and polyadenylation specificity factor subunit 2
MLNLIRNTIGKGGSVLIPSDSTGRALELAYFLEGEWNKSLTKDRALSAASLYFASATGRTTARFAQNMLEWMDPDITRDLESSGQDGNQRNDGRQGGDRNVLAPFEFKSLHFLEKRRQLDKALSQTGPKVFLAEDVSLEWGYSRSLFEILASNNQNLIIMPEPAELSTDNRPTIAYSLYDAWAQRAGLRSDSANVEKTLRHVYSADGIEITYSEVQLQPLGGNDLVAYQQYLAREQQRHRALEAEKGPDRDAEVDEIGDDNASSSDESEISDSEQQGKALNMSAVLTHSRNKAALTDAELGVDILIRRKGHYDYDVRGKRGKERMFPVLPVKHSQRRDDFGDAIRAEDYLRAEEREINDQSTNAKGTTEAAVGQKRKWNEVATEVTSNVRGGPDGKRRRAADGIVSTAGEGDGEDVSDEESDEEDEAAVGPQRITRTRKSVALYAQVAYVDFCGLHDKRTMEMLIPLIKPRKLILTGGHKEETVLLENECKQLLALGPQITADKSEVLAPLEGQTIDASVDTNAWNVKLSFSLRQQLHWQTVSGLGVVPLTSHLSIEVAESRHQQSADENKSKKLKNGERDAADQEEEAEGEGKKTETSVPLLDVVPATMGSVSRITTKPFHVGDLRLSDLRKVMQALGFHAELRGEGTLLVNGQVVVRKSAVGKIEVESVSGIPGFPFLDPTFNEVRRNIYAGLAVVSGS